MIPGDRVKNLKTGQKGTIILKQKYGFLVNYSDRNGISFRKSHPKNLEVIEKVKYGGFTSRMKGNDEILENIYHLGQRRVWDGKTVLANLLEDNDGIGKIPPEKSKSLQRIFAVILAGELAAWKVSLQLGSMLRTTEARMAATSQAHDEARHFYVMRDYLEIYDEKLPEVPVAVSQALEMILSTTSLAKKLLGMQLMVEPIAITIFHEVRKSNIEPVLSELLRYFEIDEARHMALGVHYLPREIKSLNPIELLFLISWQFKLFRLELKGLNYLKQDFINLDIDPNMLFSLAEQKQLDALYQVSEQIGLPAEIWIPLRKYMKYQKNRIFRGQ